jgi:hypothetical protein
MFTLYHVKDPQYRFADVVSLLFEYLCEQLHSAIAIRTNTNLKYYKAYKVKQLCKD